MNYLKLLWCMKKFLIFLLCVVLALLFVGCSAFDSAPINPKILGVEYIQQERGLIFVEIDSMRYPVTSVFTGETYPRVGGFETIEPVDGMLVTVANFGGREYVGVQFMQGEWNEAQIEDVFRRNYTFGVVLLAMMLIFVIYVFIIIAREDMRKSRELNKT